MLASVTQVSIAEKQFQNAALHTSVVQPKTPPQCPSAKGRGSGWESDNIFSVMVMVSTSLEVKQTNKAADVL